KPRWVATDRAIDDCSPSMASSRTADSCSRPLAFCSRCWPAPVKKNNAARKPMMRKGGTATYQRPKPSSASPRMFTRFMLHCSRNRMKRECGARESVQGQGHRIGQLFGGEIDRKCNHRHPFPAGEPRFECLERHGFG